MKKIYGIAALTAAMTLASCSNDNEPNNPVVGGTEKAYINVSLVGADGTTRADEFSSDANIKGKEAYVDHVQFFAFNGQNYIGKSAPITNFVFSAGTGEVDKKSNRVIEIEKSAVGNKEITDIICVVNGENFAPAANSTVDDFRYQLDQYNQNGDYFVMSNSAYGSGNYTTSFEGKVYSSYLQAEGAEATDIYVERVAARLDITKGDNWPTEAFASGAKVGGKDVMVTITAVDVLRNPSTAYLIKNIDGITETWSWDDSTNFRSHWAAWKTDKTPEIPHIGYSAVSDKAFQYLYENVSADKEDQTHVLVTATYTVDGQSVEVFRSENTGDYVVEEGAKKLVANYLQNEGYQWKKVETVGDQEKTETASVDVADIEIVASGAANVDWEGVAKINAKEGFTLFKGETETTVDVANADMNKADSKKYKFYKWGGNKTYYYCAIAPKDQGNGKAGVIRNHVYSVTLDEIQGLGNPLFNPNDDLKIKDIPKITVDDTKWYLNATINILKWKVYTQGMSFGEE